MSEQDIDPTKLLSKEESDLLMLMRREGVLAMAIPGNSMAAVVLDTDILAHIDYASCKRMEELGLIEVALQEQQIRWFQITELGRQQ